VLSADGFESCVLGVGRRCGQPDLIVYSIERCAELLVERDGLDYSEAMDYLEFNSIGAWVGEETPVWVHEMTWEEVEEYAQDA
jgi:hypothetical protein